MHWCNKGGTDLHTQAKVMIVSATDTNPVLCPRWKTYFFFECGSTQSFTAHIVVYTCLRLRAGGVTIDKQRYTRLASYWAVKGYFSGVDWDTTGIVLHYVSRLFLLIFTPLLLLPFQLQLVLKTPARGYTADSLRVASWFWKHCTIVNTDVIVSSHSL